MRGGARRFGLGCAILPGQHSRTPRPQILILGWPRAGPRPLTGPSPGGRLPFGVFAVNALFATAGQGLVFPATSATALPLGDQQPPIRNKAIPTPEKV